MAADVVVVVVAAEAGVLVPKEELTAGIEKDGVEPAVVAAGVEKRPEAGEAGVVLTVEAKPVPPPKPENTGFVGAGLALAVVAGVAGVAGAVLERTEPVVVTVDGKPVVPPKPENAGFAGAGLAALVVLAAEAV